MNITPGIQDLIVVVADVDAEVTVKALLRREKSLHIRKISVKVDRFVKRDSGCYGDSHNFLRPFTKQFAHALVIFDRHGCGQEKRDRETIEEDVEKRLASNGWSGRSAVIALDPELEIWVWSDSPEVGRNLGWAEKEPALRTWLSEAGLWPLDATKPDDPKRAMERALRESRKQRSPMIFRKLAEQVGLRRCSDPAFAKFTATLQHWFPAE